PTWAGISRRGGRCQTGAGHADRVQRPVEADEQLYHLPEGVVKKCFAWEREPRLYSLNNLGGPAASSAHVSRNPGQVGRLQPKLSKDELCHACISRNLSSSCPCGRQRVRKRSKERVETPGAAGAWREDAGSAHSVRGPEDGTRMEADGYTRVDRDGGLHPDPREGRSLAGGSEGERK